MPEVACNETRCDYWEAGGCLAKAITIRRCEHESPYCDTMEQKARNTKNNKVIGRFS